jgi:peptide/nickel transport system substrate-binding protein
LPKLCRLFVICLLDCLVAVACTRERPAPVDTLTVAIGAEPVTLDPRFATDAYGSRIAGLIFSSLVRLGPGLNAEPDAAEDWTKKNQTYVFNLRPGLVFHNGRPVQPEDLLYSFAEFMKPGRPYASDLAVIKSVAATSVNGRIRVTIELKSPSPAFLNAVLPAVKLLPKAQAQDSRFPAIGSGPYKFLAQDPNQITLESVRGKMRFIKFKIIRDDFTRYLKTLNGEIDINPGEIAFDKVAEFEKLKDKFTVYRTDNLAMTYLAVNFRDPLLRQKAVRLALARSLDREEIIRYKLQGFGRPATSILTPSNPFFANDLVNPALDVKSARDAIAKLGATGKELTLKTSNAASAIDNGKVLAHQLARSGLNIKLQSFEWATFYDDIKKGRFQLATMRWVGVIDPEIYRQAFHSKEFPPGRNRGAYSNPDLDALLLRGSTEENPGRRHAIYSQVQKIVQDDIAMIPLWYDQQITVTKKNILNFHAQQSGDYRPLTQVTKSP